MPERLLVLGLDGFEISLAERWMKTGEMPHLAALAGRAAAFEVDHGKARATGLAWEHIATGQAPGEGGRWSAVTFDPDSYTVRQDPTRARPVFADMRSQLVVFDTPYFDLGRTAARGITSWGAHDPGVSALGQPAGLDRELETRFGAYRARDWVYGFTWPSAARTAAAGQALVEAVRQRSQVAEWLLKERVPDWDVALLCVSEPHSAIEQFWHGVDPDHPLHGLPSARPAGEALRQIYREIDTLIGRLSRSFPDAGVVVFAMHGMGPNQADVAAMALLPELLYRLAFGRPYARAARWDRSTADGVPIVGADERWDTAMRAIVPPASGTRNRWVGLLSLRAFTGPRIYPHRSASGNLGWMPAARYQPFWRDMPAFALPAFYDGQIRLNLAGRERHGLVRPERFVKARDQIVAQLRATRCLLTGRPAVADIWYPESGPLERAPTEADIYIQWNGTPLGLEHPDAGTIGPYPFRRTGGHTGHRGFAYFDIPGIAQDLRRDGAARSAFDIVPTIFSLAGEALPPGLSGTPIFGATPWAT